MVITALLVCLFRTFACFFLLLQVLILLYYRYCALILALAGGGLIACDQGLINFPPLLLIHFITIYTYL